METGSETTIKFESTDERIAGIIGPTSIFGHENVHEIPVNLVSYQFNDVKLRKDLCINQLSSKILSAVLFFFLSETSRCESTCKYFFF